MAEAREHPDSLEPGLKSIVEQSLDTAKKDILRRLGEAERNTFPSAKHVDPPKAVNPPRPRPAHQWPWVPDTVIESIKNGKFNVDELCDLQRRPWNRTQYHTMRNLGCFLSAWTVYMSIRITVDPKWGPALAIFTEHVVQFSSETRNFISDVAEHVLSYFRLYQDAAPEKWCRTYESSAPYFLHPLHVSSPSPTPSASPSASPPPAPPPTQYQVLSPPPPPSLLPPLHPDLSPSPPPSPIGDRSPVRPAATSGAILEGPLFSLPTGSSHKIDRIVLNEFSGHFPCGDDLVYESMLRRLSSFISLIDDRHWYGSGEDERSRFFTLLSTQDGLNCTPLFRLLC